MAIAIPPSTRIPLLDLQPELGVGLSGRADERALAREVRVTTFELPVGPWSPPAELLRQPGLVALLVVEGLLVRDLLVGSIAATELLSDGDLAVLTPAPDAMLPLDVRWTVAVEVRLAVLDREGLTALERWPSIGGRLLQSTVGQNRRLAAHRAIAQLPRVEDRLLAVLWLLAERFGRVGAAGIVVPVALTHETLGRLVGARRSTVSIALKELASGGTVARRPDGAWVLAADSSSRLATEDGWSPPEIGLLAAPPAAQPPPPTHAAPPFGVEALAERLQGLIGAGELHRHRTAEVLAQCAQTREAVKVSRERRRRPGAPPSP